MIETPPVEVNGEPVITAELLASFLEMGSDIKYILLFSLGGLAVLISSVFILIFVLSFKR